MTPVTDAPHSVTPSVKQRWRRWRFPLGVVAALVLAAVVLALLSGPASRGYLDPDGVNMSGARALARLLEGQGVEVTSVRTTHEAVDATVAGDTLLVTEPDRLLPEQIDQLLGLGAEIVLIAPQDIDQFAPDLFVAGQTSEQVVQPQCELETAVRAGDARLGGIQYDGSDDATRCYLVDDDASLIIGTSIFGGRVVAFGTGAPLTNEHLDQDGNAALAMGLLGHNERLTWYRPSVERTTGEQQSFIDLVPGWVGPVTWQLVIAAGFAAWWRGRRLGRVVSEPLPVVVRAAEATEGRAGLYRRGRARAHAAEMLREAAAGRLRRRLGLPSGTAMSTVAAAASERSSLPPHAVVDMFTGPAPTDDAALVRLAESLDELEREVRTP